MRLLMCQPRYYGIEYEINPWMSRSRQSNRELAEEQWKQLYGLLRDELQFEIEVVEPRPGLPDMVFTANAGLVWQDKFIASRFRHEARRGETPHYEKWFKLKGYKIFNPPEESFFEGEGDLLLCGELFFAGYHIRSDVQGHQRVAEIIEREILSLELTNDWFYHLDTCFCPLAAGKALFYPPAFDTYALEVLESHIATLIAVPEAEARKFACNAVVVGNRVVMNDGCPETRRQLESLGYTVLETPLSEFIKAGGSAKCLVLRVPHRQD